MKKIWKIFLLALFFGAILFPALPSEAGLNNKIIDTTSYEDVLDESDWYNADGDVIVKKGIITFQNESSSATKLLSKEIVQASKQIDDMLDTRFTIKFNSLPQGEKFVFAIGLQSLQAELSQQGNVEIAFMNENGTHKISVTVFTEDGKAEQLVQATNCGQGSVKVAVVVTTKQEMKLTVGNKKIYDGSIPVSGMGSVGFLQTGSCGAEVRDLVVQSYKYDTPESPSFEEDFETGFFNSNLLLSKLLSGTDFTPSEMRIGTYKDNKVLMFKNTGMAYIGTKYAYSNFELTFDVPYCQYESELDEKGNVITPESGVLGVAFGSDGIDHTDYPGYVTAAEMFCIGTKGGGFVFHSNETIYADKLNLKNGAFSIRLTVIDGNITLSMKKLQDTTYQTIYTRKMTSSPTGNVIIWTPSGAAATWYIDNIKMVNRDVDGNDIEVEYKSSERIVPDDFDYEPLGYEYNPESVNNDEVKSTTAWYQPIVIVTIVCACALGVTGISCIVRKKKRKAGAVNEK